MNIPKDVHLYSYNFILPFVHISDVPLCCVFKVFQGEIKIRYHANISYGWDVQ